MVTTISAIIVVLATFIAAAAQTHNQGVHECPGTSENGKVCTLTFQPVKWECFLLIFDCKWVKNGDLVKRDVKAPCRYGCGYIELGGGNKIVGCGVDDNKGNWPWTPLQGCKAGCGPVNWRDSHAPNEGSCEPNLENSQRLVALGKQEKFLTWNEMAGSKR